MKNNELIILDIGIEICLSCPYEDCIGTSTELCHRMKDEVKRVRAEIDTRRQKEEKEVLANIQGAINGGGLTMPEIREKTGYQYDEIEALRRNGKLLFEKERIGRKISIVITGIKAS